MVGHSCNCGHCSCGVRKEINLIEALHDPAVTTGDVQVKAIYAALLVVLLRSSYLKFHSRLSLDLSCDHY